MKVIETDEGQALVHVDQLIKEGYKTKEAIKIVALLFNSNKK